MYSFLDLLKTDLTSTDYVNIVIRIHYKDACNILVLTTWIRIRNYSLQIRILPLLKSYW